MRVYCSSLPAADSPAVKRLSLLIRPSPEKDWSVEDAAVEHMWRTQPDFMMLYQALAQLVRPLGTCLTQASTL